jgi:hypothetical protein
MKSYLKLALVGAIAAVTLPVAAQAQWWSQHPGYLHAMSDLRSAYWLIQHRGPTDPMQGAEEHHAMDEIRAAYQALKEASIVDDKNIDDQPPADFVGGDHGGRLHKALDLLRRAHDEIGQEEDNPAARGLRGAATHHIDDAGRWTAAALQAWHF